MVDNKSGNDKYNNSSNYEKLGDYFDDDMIFDSVFKVTWGEIKKIWREEAREEAIEIGRNFEKQDGIRSAFNEGLPPDVISRIFKVSQGEVRKITDQQPDIETFRKMLDDLQKWAAENHLTEEDVRDAIQKARGHKK